MASEKLTALRSLMKERNIDIYVVPTADFHESEYVGEYFKARKFLTGFSGSAGNAVVTQEEAGLWADGRYYIQAERQIEGTGFELYKMGLPGVPTVNEFIASKLPENGVIGFDGRVINASWGLQMKDIAEKKNGSLAVTEDLVGMIWEDRPAISREPAWILTEEYSGESAVSKLNRIRKEMDLTGTSMYVLTTLDDIAWTLNIRGNDVKHYPVVLSYLVITKKSCILYVQEEALNEEVKAYLESIPVSVAPYADVYKIAETLSERSVGKVLLSKAKVNYRIYEKIAAANEIVDCMNPTIPMKAVKNEVELANIRKAHIKDGVALVRWIKWVKENIGKIPMDEVSVSDKLQEFRAAQEGYLDISFDTICAYGPNAAMMHYSATKDNFSVIEPKGFLLVDSGGHYKEGSTDVTRTIVMGRVSEEEKRLFTTVLRSNMNLAAAKFLHGCTGINLDILARGPLWEMGIDYRCGTGHGVGYLLNIHEAPNGFRWQRVPERMDSAVLEPGMVTTDEPGVYIDGVLGIRTENELILREDEKNEYGQFLSFEQVTYCPIDLEAVDVTLLSEKERAMLNNYHLMVRRILSPYLTYEEKLWLRYETREV